ncbi:MAG: restriction endonuclease subunit S [Lachnospiraceae bacterium]|nr:restriction endonuclease subunit S [Lachnospiraceae bacterium]
MARRMKDSGVEWIGEIPEEWEVIPHKYIMHRKKEICDKYNNEDIISLTMNGVIVRDLINPIGKMPASFDGYQKVYAGNLLMCLFDIDVTSRCIGYIRNNGLTSPAYSQFVVDNCNYAQYYNYLLRMIDDGKYFLHLSKNLRNSLTEENFGVIKTVRPPIEEQKKIADFLDEKVGEIDSVIARTKETIEDYKKYKQAIITEVVTKGLNPDVEMKDSENDWIGSIPSHWRLTKVKVISEKVTDGAHTSPETNNGIYDFISTVNLGNHMIDFEDCLKTSESSYHQLVKNGCKPQINDVLISKDGTVGKTVVVDFEGEFVVASSLVIIRPNLELVNPYYLDYNLQAKFVQEQLVMLMQGAGLKRVSVEKNANLPVLLPLLAEQKEIVEYLDERCPEIDKLIAKKEELLADLENYKKSLIYEYVTGKKKIRDDI